MNPLSLPRRVVIFSALAAAALGGGFSTAVLASNFPPLNVPANMEVHAGKFLWAELFTTDPDSATRFYSGVFGWTASTVMQEGETYTVFANGNHPVAGLRRRSTTARSGASRWVGYIAVPDIKVTLARVAKAGGEIRAPARAFPEIGSQAIITDMEGAPVGLVQSTSGSSPDVDPAPGDWNWFHLLAKSPSTAAEFYRQVFNYIVIPDSRPGKAGELLLTTGAFNRGGVSALGDAADAKPGWLGVVRVKDLTATLSQVRKLGGAVTTEPHDASFGSRFAIIADPTGGVVGVVEYVNDANPVNRP